MTKSPTIFIRHLTGYSGCVLSLFRNGDGLFVRKMSTDKSYNQRLNRQCIKQKILGGHTFSTPKVLRRGVDDNGMFYFDMAFLNCQSMDKYFNTIPMSDIPGIVSTLFKNLAITESTWTGAGLRAITEKLTELHAKISTPTVNIVNSLNLLDEYDFSNIPESACHGDLTLENMMISNCGKIYLIDFLDSFCNSWIIDVAKVLQDIDLHWSYRHITMSATLELRLMVAKEEILSNILAMQDGQRIMSDIYHILLLNVLRIFPYARDEKTFTFLDGALGKVLDQIKRRDMS